MIIHNVWVLTVILVGTTIEFTEPPTDTYDHCREEGIRQLLDYQAGNIQAHWECEEHPGEIIPVEHQEEIEA
jgi:hypothetical protein